MIKELAELPLEASWVSHCNTLQWPLLLYIEQTGIMSDLPDGMAGLPIPRVAAAALACQGDSGQPCVCTTGRCSCLGLVGHRRERRAGANP